MQERYDLAPAEVNRDLLHFPLHTPLWFWFAAIGLGAMPIISLAKREEEIYRPGDAEPLRLSRHAAALRLLQYVRDEAHRFAQHYLHLLRRKKLREE